jgi:carboxyl-terminal processing protease
MFMRNDGWLTKLLTVVLLLAIGAVGGYNVGVKGTFLGWKVPFLPEPEVVYQVADTTRPVKYQTMDFGLFWRVWEQLENKYLEPSALNSGKMVDGAIAGMVAAVGDPYTVYLPREEKKISEDDLSGSFDGVGIELGYLDEVLAVTSPIKGAPAEKAGVQAGDFIMHIKDEGIGVDEDSYAWSLDKAQSVLRGRKGTKVTMTLLRKDYNDSLPFEVELVREVINIDSLELEFLTRGGQTFAYLQLSRFGERTYEEWNQAVNEILRRKGEVKGVILDMRNNPGGLVTEAVHIASEFIDSGVIVTEKGRSNERDYVATGMGRLVGIPLVVQINRGSASASEIVAGALRDNLGAKIVGIKSFGKGFIQQRFDLENGAGLNVTIAKWVMPNGEWLGEEGIAPDVEVEDNRETVDVDEVLETSLTLF